MSFSENPFREMVVVAHEDGSVSWECSSCGGGYRTRFDPSISVEHLRGHWLDHVRISHERTEESFR
jgi:hypothetical protein